MSRDDFAVELIVSSAFAVNVAMAVPDDTCGCGSPRSALSAAKMVAKAAKAGSGQTGSGNATSLSNAVSALKANAAGAYKGSR